MGRTYDFDLDAEIVVTNNIFDKLFKRLSELDIRYMDWQNKIEKNFADQELLNILHKDLAFSESPTAFAIIHKQKTGALEFYSKEGINYISLSGFGFDEKVHFEHEYEQDVPSSVELFLKILEPLPVKNINLWWELDFLRKHLKDYRLGKNSLILCVGLIYNIDFLDLFKCLNLYGYTIYSDQTSCTEMDYIDAFFNMDTIFDKKIPYSFFVKHENFGYQMQIVLQPNIIEIAVLEPYALKTFESVKIIDIIHYLKPFVQAAENYGMEEIQTNFDEIA